MKKNTLIKTIIVAFAFLTLSCGQDFLNVKPKGALSVSQISEKGALGSRLVTAMGRVIGTLELRRMVSGTFALCMVALFHVTRFHGAFEELLRAVPARG